MCIQNPIHFIKLRIQAASLLLGVFLLSACAATDSAKQQASASASLPSPAISQPVIGKKVQTAKELITKLKEGFYSGALTQPEFYARELGYPLKEPLRYAPWNVRDENRYQEIKFNSSELTYVSAGITSETNKKGQRIMHLRTIQLWMVPTCMTVSEIFNIWNFSKFSRNEQVQYHRTDTNRNLLPPAEIWETLEQIRGKKHIVKFEVNDRNRCVSYIDLHLED